MRCDLFVPRDRVSGLRRLRRHLVRLSPPGDPHGEEFRSEAETGRVSHVCNQYGVGGGVEKVGAASGKEMVCWS